MTYSRIASHSFACEENPVLSKGRRQKEKDGGPRRSLRRVKKSRRRRRLLLLGTKRKRSPWKRGGKILSDGRGKGGSGDDHAATKTSGRGGPHPLKRDDSTKSAAKERKRESSLSYRAKRAPIIQRKEIHIIPPNQVRSEKN